MPKAKTREEMDFGARLAELRKERGFTQLELAEQAGLSRRMLAYWPTMRARTSSRRLRTCLATPAPWAWRPTNCWGWWRVKATARQKDSRLQRRMQEIEKLAAQRSARTKATPAGAGVGGGLLSFKYSFQRNLASLAVRIFVTLQNNSHWPLRINVKEAGLQW